MISRSLRTFQILLILLLLLINYYNISVIPNTISRNAKSLVSAEAFLSQLCHRMPSRSFWILEVPMGLCSRCTGIYFGILISLCFFFFAKKYFTKKYLKISLLILLPLVIDGSLQLMGTYLSFNIIRLITGLLFGISVGFLFNYLIFLINSKESV